jgi:hypothetical protein
MPFHTYLFRRKVMFRTIIFVSMLGLMLVLSGCATSGSSSSTTSKPIIYSDENGSKTVTPPKYREGKLYRNIENGIYIYELDPKFRELRILCNKFVSDYSGGSPVGTKMKDYDSCLRQLGYEEVK